jgi:hypothetical protein
MIRCWSGWFRAVFYPTLPLLGAAMLFSSFRTWYNMYEQLCTNISVFLAVLALASLQLSLGLFLLLRLVGGCPSHVNIEIFFLK